MLTTQIGPYRLLRRLGIGGMAEAYHARRSLPEGIEQTVCLKVILPQHATTREYTDAFLDEARLQVHLHHQNIIQVLDFGRADDGNYYIALELMNGCDLLTLTKKYAEAGQLLPFSVSMMVCLCIANALEEAHNLRIQGVPQHLVHRDVTPSNMFVDRNGHVKLADFGVARAQSRKQQKSQSGMTKGKLFYMSPEQVSQPSTVDARTDIFALGVVLFELLAGRNPFYRQDMTDFQMAQAIAGGDRLSLRQVIPDVRPEVEAIVDAMLATNRENRPQTAGQVAQLLAPFVSQFAAEQELKRMVEWACGPYVEPVERPSGMSVDTVAIAPRVGSSPSSQQAAARSSGRPVALGAPPQFDTVSAQRTAGQLETGLRSRPWKGAALMATGAAMVGALIAVVVLGRGSQDADQKPGGAEIGPPTETVKATPDKVNRARAVAVEPSLPPVREPAPLPVREPQAEVVLNTPDTEEAPSRPHRERRAATAATIPHKARLDVVVTPFGEVFVDGRSIGPSPAQVQLAPGVHSVTAERGDRRSPPRKVELQPGASERVTIKL